MRSVPRQDGKKRSRFAGRIRLLPFVPLLRSLTRQASVFPPLESVAGRKAFFRHQKEVQRRGAHLVSPQITYLRIPEAPQARTNRAIARNLAENVFFRRLLDRTAWDPRESPAGCRAGGARKLNVLFGKHLREKAGGREARGSRTRPPDSSAKGLVPGGRAPCSSKHDVLGPAIGSPLEPGCARPPRYRRKDSA